MKFTEGEEILAKSANSSDYYKGTVLGARGEKYRILSEDGNEFTVHESNLKVQRASRSGTRTSKRTAARSPAPQSSSRRSPSRRSPSRRSPSRRSPARSPTTPARKLPVRSARASRKMTIPEYDITKDSENARETIIKEDIPEAKIPTVTSLRDSGPVTRRSIRLLSDEAEKMYENMKTHRLIVLTKKIDRAVSLPVEKTKQKYDFAAEIKERGMSMQREQDLSTKSPFDSKTESRTDPEFAKPRKKMDLVAEPQEWGGWLGSLFLIFALPLCVALPQIPCQNNECKASNFRVSTNWREYLNFNVILLYVGFVGFQTLLSILPVGRLVFGQQSRIGRLQYRMNGLLAASLSIGILLVCHLRGHHVGDYLLDHCLHLMIGGWCIGAASAVLLFVKGGRAPVFTLNMFASTNNLIYDFWQGREINPRVGSVDVKIVLFRTGLIGMLLLNAAVVAKTVEESSVQTTGEGSSNAAILLVAGLQIFYGLESLLCESSILTTFEIQYEGTGYLLCVGHLIYPFLPTLVTRYLYYHRSDQSGYILGLIVVLFIVGYVIYRSSNSQKDEFRKNPLSPALADMETIPTSHGKKLLVSGWWGHVRHPNYLGDLIMHWSLASVCLTTEILPYYAAFFLTFNLIYRAIRGDRRCRIRYGSAWDCYCSRVEYVMLKHIF